MRGAFRDRKSCRDIVLNVQFLAMVTGEGAKSKMPTRNFQGG
jgi:hypothetical protein